jgi:hypothetical protein
LPVRNPDFSQSSELPLFTKGLRFYPNLRNISVTQKKMAGKFRNPWQIAQALYFILRLP